MVKLPSGEIFKLRKIEVIDFLTRTMVPLGFIDLEDMKTWSDKTTEERTEIIEKNTTKEKSEEMSKMMIAAGVQEPRITLNEIGNDNEISVYEIETSDRVFLIDEITKFSGLTKEGREDISPFPARERSDAGRDGESLREDATRAATPGN
jgi:hypothetical protein